MHRELVEKRRWISDKRFLHALNYCMVLPGPEAQQMTIYIGWLLHKRWGGIVAGALFVLPGAVFMLAVSYAYLLWGSIPWVEAIFHGLKTAVMAIVLTALIKMSRKILHSTPLIIIALLAFAALFFANLPFPLIILSALAAGLFCSRFAPQWLQRKAHRQGTTATDESCYLISEYSASPHRPCSLRTYLSELLLGVGLWLAPVIACLLLLGKSDILTQVGLFFSKVALITFGGAYAVLPYVAQQSVEVQQWLTPLQMMDGLGLAETTPGPLVLVLQFVGFISGWQQANVFSPELTALLAAIITAWLIFVPGYLFIFLGAPFMEKARENRMLESALSAVTAAVVGVVCNLSLWFAIHWLVADNGTISWVPLLVAGFLVFAIQKWNWDTFAVIGAGAAYGWIALYW